MTLLDFEESTVLGKQADRYFPTCSCSDTNINKIEL